MNSSSTGHLSSEDLKLALDQLQQSALVLDKAKAEMVSLSFTILKSVIPTAIAVSPEVEADYDDSGQSVERQRGIWIETDTGAGYDVPGLCIVSQQARLLGDRPVKEFYEAMPQAGEPLVDAVVRRVSEQLRIDVALARLLMSTADLLGKFIHCRQEIGQFDPALIEDFWTDPDHLTYVDICSATQTTGQVPVTAIGVMGEDPSV